MIDYKNAKPDECKKFSTEDVLKILDSYQIECQLKYNTGTVPDAREWYANKETTFLDMALEYKKEYENTSWWKFKKRSELKKNWYSARECMIRYGRI